MEKYVTVPITVMPSRIIFHFLVWRSNLLGTCHLLSQLLIQPSYLMLNLYSPTSVCFSLDDWITLYYCRVTFCSCIWARILFVQEKLWCLMSMYVPFNFRLLFFLGLLFTKSFWVQFFLVVMFNLLPKMSSPSSFQGVEITATNFLIWLFWLWISWGTFSCWAL